MQTGTYQPSKSVIRVSPFEGYTSYAPYTCTQCAEGWCMTACPVGAIRINAAGAKDVVDDTCVGCKLCTIACPYGTMFYDADTTKAYKCNLCEGHPACAEACPTGALSFGKRGSLLELAKGRIYRNPDKYVHHVYGEHEAGGTDWLYITDIPFDKLGMKKVRHEAYPDKVQGALGAPPFVMTLWPPLLMGLYTFSKRRDQVSHEAHPDAKPTTPEENGGRHG